MSRFLHPRVAAVLSALMVAVTGSVVRGEDTMSKNVNRTRLAVPPVFTTRNGSRYVRPIDVIRSIAGRKELTRQLENAPKNGDVSQDTQTKENPKR